MNRLHVTFCILAFKRTPWLKRSIHAILKYCAIEHSVKILSQGQPDPELTAFLTNLNQRNIELIVSPVNLGCGGGRNLLAPKVVSPFTMMLDDDMYLTDNSIKCAMDVLSREREIGAVSMPQYDLQGHMISPGGRKLILRDGKVLRKWPSFDGATDWIEVEDLDGGAMLYRTEMRECFSWDTRYSGGFDDLDKSLSIMRSGKWKQAIIPKGKLIHDRSWHGIRPAYEKHRYNALATRDSYNLFRRKWQVRLDMQSHLLFALVFPTLGLVPAAFPASAIRQLNMIRTISRLQRLRTLA